MNEDISINPSVSLLSEQDSLSFNVLELIGSDHAHNSPFNSSLIKISSNHFFNQLDVTDFITNSDSSSNSVFDLKNNRNKVSRDITSRVKTSLNSTKGRNL